MTHVLVVVIEGREDDDDAEVIAVVADGAIATARQAVQEYVGDFVRVEWTSAQFEGDLMRAKWRMTPSAYPDRAYVKRMEVQG